MGNIVLYAVLALVGMLFLAALGVLVIVGIVKLAGRGKSKSVATLSAPIAQSDSNMFAALSGGGPEATAIVKDAHLRFGLRRNLREHYEATKHLMDDPTPPPPSAPAVPNSPPASPIVTP